MKHILSAKLALIDLMYTAAMEIVGRLEQARARTWKAWRGCKA